MKRIAIHFANPGYAPLELDAHTPLASALDILSSPVLFGCRNGICGTCVVSVQALDEHALPPPSEDERELLEIVAEGDLTARLACQIDLTCDIRILCRS